MIALLGAGISIGAAVGWYGHKAYVRIDTWGRNVEERETVVCTEDCHLCADPRLRRPSCDSLIIADDEPSPSRSVADLHPWFQRARDPDPLRRR